MTQLYANIAGISWLVFVAVWVVMGFSAKKTARRSVRGWLPRIIISAVIFLFLTEPSLKGYLTFENFAMPWPAVGAVLTIIGVAVCIWARMYLGRNWGMPQTLKAGAELVTSGPYKWVRNPIYSGCLLAIFGSAFIWPWMWFLLIFIGWYFIWSAKVEEKIMRETFPDTYPRYKARTKMLIPFVF